MLGPLAQSLESYLDLLVSRQKLVASNIANTDTPGYRTQDIDFQSELDQILRQPEAPHQPGSLQPRTQEVEGLDVKNDGNNVSLEREARLLAETAMRFQMASTMIEQRIRLTRMAIKEGNGA